MKFIKCEIDGILICEPKKYYDNRGFFFESFRKDLFENFTNTKINFCQENISESKYGVLRGLHYQKNPYGQSKLISVIEGKILDVVVDIRKNSKHYGKHFSIELDDIEHKQLYIPKGFAHGFITLSKTAKVFYKVDNFYNPQYEDGLNFNDPSLNIDWKIDTNLIIVGEKDTNHPAFDKKKHYE